MEKECLYFSHVPWKNSLWMDIRYFSCNLTISITFLELCEPHDNLRSFSKSRLPRSFIHIQSQLASGDLNCFSASPYLEQPLSVCAAISLTKIENRVQYQRFLINHSLECSKQQEQRPKKGNKPSLGNAPAVALHS